MEKKRVLLMSDLHYCQEEYGGISRDEKANRILEFIRAEHEKFPFSAIFFLGDYSLDHWAWNTKGCYLNDGMSYTRVLVENLMPRLKKLGVPICMIAGTRHITSTTITRPRARPKIPPSSQSKPRTIGKEMT